MSIDTSRRDSWSSKIGFVLAAAGSAIGLGNIWGFPTQTGQNGGAVFVFVYLLCVLLVGVPLMIAELTLGRRAKSDPVGAFRTLAPGTPWKWVGALGVLTGFVILSYYSVLAGWTLKYLVLTAGGAFEGTDPSRINDIFNSFTSSGVEVILFHLLFMALTVWVVTGGIQGGIERVTTILMPLLFLLLIVLVIRSVTLEGAWAGVEFYLKPDFSKITGGVIVAAMGQALFSLSLGMGAMITYGSYLSSREDLVSSAVYVSLSDLLIAFLAGFAIFPALFTVEGLTPNAGPQLIYLVLPNIFNQIPMGRLFGLAFYVLLLIAALTSAISLLEVVVTYLIDQRHWQRRKAALAVGAGALLTGVPSALSVSFLGQVDFVFGKISLIIGAFFICLFLAWKWGMTAALSEIKLSNARFTLAPLWSILIRFLCPIAIAILLVQEMWNRFSN